THLSARSNPPGALSWRCDSISADPDPRHSPTFLPLLLYFPRGHKPTHVTLAQSQDFADVLRFHASDDQLEDQGLLDRFEFPRQWIVRLRRHPTLPSWALGRLSASHSPKSKTCQGCGR